MLRFKQLFEREDYYDLYHHYELPNPPSNIITYDNEFHEDLSKHLHNEQKPLHDPEMDPFYLNSFTTDYDARSPHDHISNSHASSRQLNKDLIEHGEPKRAIDHKIHEAIVNNISPAKRDFHVYSGTRANLGDLAKQSKDMILHSAAHISASSCPNVAKEHIERIHENSTAVHHIAHIHVQKGNPYLHVSEYSKYPEEYETIIPVGTKLKFSHTTYHRANASTPRKKPIDFHVHHFTITD
jgi:hypothetical protein